jgi:hypothetical protein
VRKLLLPLLFTLGPAAAWAQEANSGFEVHGTLSGLAAYSQELARDPRDGAPITGGFRGMLYPTLKLSRNWSISGSFGVYSRPYFYEQFSTQGHGAKFDILQAHLTYSRIRGNRSLVVRVGQLATAFGSFLLRYDDSVNPLIDVPLSYGYYGKGVSLLGLAGAQVETTLAKLDMRAQFVNSSPANRRSVFDRDQYGNWAGGIGYTIAQGFRVGVSAYRGPYLYRSSDDYFPGEAKPRDLPGTAYGVDVQWGRGPWNAYGEFQRFQFAYHAIPTFKEDTAYGELRRVLHPRWYVASRVSYLRANVIPIFRVYENAVGFRPNRYQLIKVGYEVEQSRAPNPSLANTFAIQLVTIFRPISIARD